MGINIAIRETECRNALCREKKLKIVRVLTDNPEKYGEAAEIQHTVSKESAEKVVDDWGSFLKRNRLGKDTETVHTELLTDENDIAKLKPLAESSYTGWVELGLLDSDDAEKALAESRPENRTTEWELVTFDEMAEICAECALSWDKGRGCIGTFGPDKSQLPGIADKYGCPIVASVPEMAASKKELTPEDAESLLKEIAILREALPKEGKQKVNWYSGTLDRMECVAEISKSEGCGFFFF
jgi:hypothetical protein